MNKFPSTRDLSGVVLAPMIACPLPVFAEAEGLYEAIRGSKFNDAPILQSNGIEFGGWMEVGVTANPHGPDNPRLW